MADNPIETPIPVPEDALPQVVNLFQNSNAEQRLLLISLFGSASFPLNITERVTDFATACEVLSIDPATINALTFPPAVPANTLPFIKLSLIFKALNENWIADLNNPNQLKYCLVPMMQNNMLVYTASTYLTTSTSVPVSLLLANDVLAKHVGAYFTELLDEYYLESTDL